MNTLDGVIVIFEESRLVRVIVTPPAGAAFPKLTGKNTDRFGAKLTLSGKIIGPNTTTVFVIKNTAGSATPDTNADTVYEPCVPLAVNIGEVATPAALVVAITV